MSCQQIHSPPFIVKSSSGMHLPWYSNSGTAETCFQRWFAIEICHTKNICKPENEKNQTAEMYSWDGNAFAILGQQWNIYSLKCMRWEGKWLYSRSNSVIQMGVYRTCVTAGNMTECWAPMSSSNQYMYMWLWPCARLVTIWRLMSWEQTFNPLVKCWNKVSFETPQVAMPCTSFQLSLSLPYSYDLQYSKRVKDSLSNRYDRFTFKDMVQEYGLGLVRLLFVP